MVYTFYIVLILLAVHFLAELTALNSSHPTASASSYSFVWFLCSWGLYQDIYSALTFTAVTFATWLAVSFLNSKLLRSYYQEPVSRGFAQLIHYVQLLLTHHFIVS